MTLQEALQSDEVQGFLGNLIQEAVASALTPEALKDVVKAAVDEQLPTLRESLREEVRDEVRKDNEVRSLHTEATRLIEASPLKGAVKANLLEDYGLVESDDDSVTPGRALRLIEAQLDDDGKVVKTAKAVLREAIDEDIKRARRVLRESAPSVPVATGGGGPGGETAPTPFLGDSSPTAQRMRDKGLDPAQFGATPTPTPAT
jgi:hypothetical protein